MSQLLEKSGKIVFLRAHDLGTRFGPPNDQLDVEAVFILNALSDGALGFQLRNDANLPARQAMFSLGRTLPSTYYAATAADLIADIKAANTAGGANTIVLTAPTTNPYVLTALAQECTKAGRPDLAQLLTTKAQMIFATTHQTPLRINLR